ncbi:MAG: GGDEF and EAL domain-containing protein [Hydrogenothermaceae bacterium]|nr:GGDEF and EAL domain-containing protein [Hydrogenothermaceae bacterium]
MNIDSFKEINDVYGFNVGDEVLKEFSVRLSNFVDIHRFTVYRVSGDEFAVLIDNHLSLRELELFVNSLIFYIQSNPFQIGEYEINLDITVGVAFSKDFSSKNILEKADMALKYAKDNRKPYFVYDEGIEIQRQFQENRRWVKTIKNAMEHNNFIVFFQPIISNLDGSREKYEALVRIKEGENYISPFYFLEVAKKAKLYHYITQVVIFKAFEVSRKHRVEISINLSIKDILNENITNQIFAQLSKSSAKITFELLESEGLENFEEVLEFIKEIKRYGVKIAIDDFGSGYSNFEYLLKMKVDYLKIDSSLIKEIDRNYELRIIVETITNFSKKLGIKTIAEFVHSKEVLDIVRDIGVDYSQGFYLGKPEPNISI